MKRIFTGLLLLAVFFTFVWPLWGEKPEKIAKKANTGSMLRKDFIRAEPFSDAKVIGALELNDNVDILKRKGGWMQVRSKLGTGWVRMLSVKRAGVSKVKYTPKGLLSLTSGRAGTGKVVLTTGIRGLNEENLKSARFNARQLELVESYAANSAKARLFAMEGKLVGRSIPYLKGEGIK